MAKITHSLFIFMPVKYEWSKPGIIPENRAFRTSMRLLKIFPDHSSLGYFDFC